MQRNGKAAGSHLKTWLELIILDWLALKRRGKASHPTCAINFPQ
jgi:hypothetical protein